MGLTENLIEIKSQTEALLEYANGVTGVNDVRLGDAVKTLCDGYGTGGASDSLTNYVLLNGVYSEVQNNSAKKPIIDTGVKYSKGHIWEVSLTLKFSNLTEEGIMCASDGTNLASMSANAWRITFANAIGADLATFRQWSDVVQTQLCTVSINLANATYSFNGASKTINNLTFPDEIDSTIKLINGNQASVKEVKIKDQDGTVIRHMIACYRPTDDVSGMFDTVTNRFFENVGTGLLAKGELA